MSDPKPAEPEPSQPWLVGGGEMGRLILAKDWSRTPLGPIESWPPSLRTTVSLVLHSNFPISLAWGPQHIQIYNDGYWPICGDKHPDSMGQDFSFCWASAFPVIGEAFRSALAGTTAFLVDQRMFLDRLGFLEETCFTFSFSPIRDESGKVAGLFHPVTETTARMLSERRTRTMRDVAALDVKLLSLPQVLARLAGILEAAANDVPFVLFYTVEEEGRTAALVGQAGLAAGSPASPGTVDLSAGATPWDLGRVAAGSGGLMIGDVAARFPGLVAGPYPEPIQAAVVYPLRLAGQEGPSGFMVAGLSTRLPLTEAYRSFLDLLAAAVEALVANATAFAEERRRATALAELDRAKTLFFSNISHEFRTPLTLVLGSLEEELAATSPDGPPARLQRLQTAHRNGRRLLRLVNTLLDFARIEAGRVQPERAWVDLAQLTAELAANFNSACEHAGLAFSVDCPPLSRAVAVDLDMWEKIVLNLLSNAFKFTLAGGIRLTLRETADGVELAVCDTGSGIPAGELPRVFERFHRIRNTPARSHEGTGIGLALTRELVGLLGGDITVASVLGQGTEFRVSLPHFEPQSAPAAASPAPVAHRRNPFVEEALQWLPDPAADAAAGPAPAGPGQRQGRIVVADDNADMRRHLMHLLGEDYQLELAGDGETALAAMRREAPDLVVSDLMMPVLDGYGMLRAMRAEEKLRTIPVILLSARAGEEERLIGLAAGAADYLAKPFTARELRSRVRAQMDLAQARHRAEATQLDELTRASERKFRNLAEAMPQIVWTTDPAGLNTYFNRHWAEYTGLSLEESHGEGWIKPFHPEDRGRAWEAWRTAVNRRGSYSLECRLRRADGEYRWWLIRGVPQVAESGEILQWFGTCTDIEDLRRGEEERRQLEAQVMMAQKLDSLGSLAGGVAHDMNNVLGAIGALAEVHRQAPGSDAALRRDMDTIAMACRRGGNLVKGLLSFARSELVREVEVDLNAVVREEILLLERTTLKKVRLEQDLEDGLAAVLGDPGALHHCLMNLCVNAVDAMPAGGTLTLRTRAEAGGRVLLEVADTGIGMPREVLDKALDPFFTTKAHGKGTGLGLSMVYGTVKTHQGTLEIESEPGAGTRVRMRFPAAPAQARSASAGLAPRARTAPAGMSVFIVDDDELILSSIPGLVQSLGHIAITAGSGEQALAQLEAGFRPDVLCLDLNMPGLDGIETLRRLRRFCPDLPVLITTGRPDQQALDLVASQPRVALLPKPFGADELVPALEWAAGWAAAGA